uniref:Ig-like domain-containing protein n=1 Tax=Myripristis murdjan TaxID=586833 RepID=A0A667YUE2_9TELE
SKSILHIKRPDLHDGMFIAGCSASNKEYMVGVDAEEVWYADFKNHKGVVTLPKFADPFSFPEFYEVAEASQEVCKQNLVRAVPAEAPAGISTIYTRNRVQLDVENRLICHVSGFFPAPVSVYWTRNEQNVTEGTSINTPYPSKDGTFTQISTLKFTPQQGDIYSCTVQHPALEQPLTRVWDVQQDQPGIGPAVFCGLGLTVGLLGVATGTFFLIKGNECS